MKTMKKVLFMAAIISIASVTYSEAKDCSKYQSATTKAICEKLGGISSGNDTASDKPKKVKKEKKDWSKNSFNEKYKTFADIFKKN